MHLSAMDRPAPLQTAERLSARRAVMRCAGRKVLGGRVTLPRSAAPRTRDYRPVAGGALGHNVVAVGAEQVIVTFIDTHIDVFSGINSANMPPVAGGRVPDLAVFGAATRGAQYPAVISNREKLITS